MGLLDIIFSAPFFWILSLLGCGALIFVTVYYLVSLSDLESDLQNPIDMCKRANACVLPEIAGHLVLTILFLLTGNWLELVLNLPLVAYNVYNVMEHKHLFDAVTIFNSLSKHKKVNFIKLVFFMLLFFLFLYRLVFSLVQLSGRRRTM